MHTPGTFENIFFPSLPAALSHLTECYARKRGRNTVWTDILPCVRYFRFHILSRKMFGHMSNNYHTHNKIVYARLQRAYARNTSFQCYCHFPGSHPVVSWPIYCIRGLFTKYCALIFDWLFFITNFVYGKLPLHSLRFDSIDTVHHATVIYPNMRICPCHIVFFKQNYNTLCNMSKRVTIYSDFIYYSLSVKSQCSCISNESV